MTLTRAPERLEEVVDRLDPVSLEELVGDAALMTRVDRKYLVARPEALAVLRTVPSATRVLDIADRRVFSYDSVYFDTAENAAYRLSATRRRRRFKVRTRWYVDTGASFLEVKTKDGRGRTVKQRLPHDTANRERLTAQGREFVAGILGRQGHARALTDALGPSMTSRYRRTTLLLPCGSRATVDTDAMWIDGDERRRLIDHVIIETKSAGRTSLLDRALWRAGHRPRSISKFGTGTAALHPDLPHNSWARALAHAFELAPSDSRL